MARALEPVVDGNQCRVHGDIRRHQQEYARFWKSFEQVGSQRADRIGFAGPWRPNDDRTAKGRALDRSYLPFPKVGKEITEREDWLERFCFSLGLAQSFGCKRAHLSGPHVDQRPQEIAGEQPDLAPN